VDIFEALNLVQIPLRASRFCGALGVPQGTILSPLLFVRAQIKARILYCTRVTKNVIGEGIINFFF
jgi:hypothetical protein